MPAKNVAHMMTYVPVPKDTYMLLSRCRTGGPVLAATDSRASLDTLDGARLREDEAGTPSSLSTKHAAGCTSSSV